MSAHAPPIFLLYYCFNTSNLWTGELLFLIAFLNLIFCFSGNVQWFFQSKWIRCVWKRWVSFACNSLTLHPWKGLEWIWIQQRLWILYVCLANTENAMASLKPCRNAGSVWLKWITSIFYSLGWPRPNSWQGREKENTRHLAMKIQKKF